MVSLSAADLNTLHALLRKRRADVGSAVQDRLHRHGLEVHEDAALPNRMQDTDDEAAATTATHLDIASVSRQAHELALLESALTRLQNGEYGECTECGDQIGLERLYANPAATRCTDCQSFAEKAARIARATRA